jgi:hypothetical protein
MQTPIPTAPRGSLPVLGGLALLGLGLHLLTAGRYGIFRDEMYYLDCAERLAWGYVDHPPLSAAVLALWRELAGSSLLALRLPAAAAGSATIVLTGLLARELGGGLYAQGLAALAVLAAPVLLSLTGFYSMNAFDLVFWTAGALLVARIARTDDVRLWPAFGVLAGLGLLNKLSMAFFGFGLLVAMALTPLRRHLREPRFWLAGALAAALFLPHLLWQAAHGWPTLEFLRNATATKNVAFSPGAFLAEQVLQMNPFAAPVWLAGLGWTLFAPAGRPFRWLGVLWLAVLGVLLLQSSKPYYLAPAFPLLLAPGAVAIERVRRGRALLRPLAAAAVLVGGALGAPLAIPLLSVPDLLRYQAALGLKAEAGERHEQGALPQHFADRFGWPELAAVLAEAYHALPPDERQRAAVYVGNYGEAGAVNLFGRPLGLPRALCAHNNHYLWGPGDATGEVLLVLSREEARPRLEQVFEQVEAVGRFEHPYAMPYESGQLVFLCRRPRVTMAQMWPELKHYN